MHDNPLFLADLDGCLADYAAGMARSLEENGIPTDGTLPEDVLNNVKRLVRRVPGWWRALPTLPLGMRLWNFANKLGFEMHVLTKAPDDADNAWSEKFAWCREHLNTTTNIAVVRNKAPMYGTVFLEDSPDNILPWLKHRKRGVVLMPVEEGWNDKFKHPQVVPIRWDPKNKNKQAETMALAGAVLMYAFVRDPKEKINWQCITPDSRTIKLTERVGHKQREMGIR